MSFFNSGFMFCFRCCCAEYVQYHIISIYICILDRVLMMSDYIPENVLYFGHKEFLVDSNEAHVHSYRDVQNFIAITGLECGKKWNEISINCTGKIFGAHKFSTLFLCRASGEDGRHRAHQQQAPPSCNYPYTAPVEGRQNPGLIGNCNSCRWIYLMEHKKYIHVSIIA